MNIAYLFFAYKNPKLMKQVIERLTTGNCAFFVHIDGKIDLSQFESIRGENVFFSNERIPVNWAEFSGVRAMLILIRQALAAPCQYDTLVLLSGSEYPLRSGKYIHRFLESNRGTQFINIVKMPNDEVGKPLSRITTLRFPARRPVARFLFRVLAKFDLAYRDYRKHLGSLEPYGGNTWWALSREACQYILDFYERNPRVNVFFENVFAPEEYYIHTVIGNSAFRSRLRRSLVFEEWLRGASHPVMISEKHISQFEAQEQVTQNDVHGSGELLFARKFSDDSLGLAKRIDDMIQRKEKQ
jgi:hypothetical protein